MSLRWTHSGAIALSFALASIAPAQAVPAPGPDAFGYRVTEIINNLRNISATGSAAGSGDDNVFGPFPLGFNFNYYGNTYSSAYVSTNGFLSFTPLGSSGCCSGPFLPGAGGPSNLVAGLWNDLNVTSGGLTRYQTLGSPGSREFVLGFYNVPHYGSNSIRVTFEILLKELADTIEIQYGSVANDGSPATAGISNLGNTIALTLVNADSSLNPGLSNRGFLFVPGPLPVVGAAAAFGWTRRLRRRVKQVASPAS